MSDRPSPRANQTFGVFALLAIARPRRIGIYFVYSELLLYQVREGRGRLRFVYLQEVAAWNRLPNASAIKITPDKRPVGFSLLDVLSSESSLARYQPYSEAVLSKYMAYYSTRTSKYNCNLNVYNKR